MYVFSFPFQPSYCLTPATILKRPSSGLINESVKEKPQQAMRTRFFPSFLSKFCSLSVLPQAPRPPVPAPKSHRTLLGCSDMPHPDDLCWG